MRAVLLAAILGSSTLLVASSAHADRSDRLMKKGKRLLAEKKYEEACAAFEEADDLDPTVGARLEAARCYEGWGRIATAYRRYQDAEKLAKETGDERLPKITEQLTELDFNVPRLTIHVPEGADPDVLATLTLDGQPFDPSLLGTAQLVDPGSHVIEYVVDGETKKKLAPVELGGESEVKLDIPKGTGKRGRGIEGDSSAGGAARPGRGQRIAGVSLVAAGGIAVGTAVALTLHARGKYNDALDAHCMGSTTMCDAEGLSITHDARSRANLATVISIAGGAAIVGGVVLYLLAPDAAAREEHALYLTPVVGEGGGAIVFGGRY
jgi:tetratricopeptide (TPR) repeat protein